MALDIYNGYHYTQKPTCNAKNSLNATTVTEIPSARNTTGNSTGIQWVAHLGEPINEMDIDLNYQLYAAACFLFALGLTY